MTNLRFGIVGTGRMAATMAKTIAGQAGAQAVAVASQSEDRARSFATRFDIPNVSGDRAMLFAEPTVDIIYIANASRHHADTSIAALEAGKHVLCEKPFARNTVEGKRVIEAAKLSGCFFMEAMWTHALPSYRRFDMLAQTNAQGAPRHLRFDFGYPVHDVDEEKLLFPDDGGVLFDRGCYGVSLALKTLGPVKDIQACTDNGMVCLQLCHEDGGQSQISVSATALLSNTVHLGCARGAIGLDAPSLGAEQLWQVAIEPAPLSNVDTSQKGMKQRLARSAFLRRLRARTKRTNREWLTYGQDHYSPMLTHVIAALKDGRSESSLVPLDLSLATVALLEKAEWEMENGS